MKKYLFVTVAALSPVMSHAQITAGAIDAAQYDGGTLPEGQSALSAKVQLLLDRADISPGVIDGYNGGMTTSAIAAFETREGMKVDGQMDPGVWSALGGDAASGLTRSHQISQDDLAKVTGPNPDDYAKMAEQDLLGYVDAAEALAEQFHMDVDFLKLLNPDADFGAGTTISVLSPKDPAKATVAEITIDKTSQRLIAKDAEGAIISNYPVSIGSAQTPSPEGSFEVKGVAVDPTYTYNPDINFQQGDNDEVLTIPPGPNGPVGVVWIDLSKPTFGIHGTPDPAALFTAQSHGCVRMTNWDAMELAQMTGPGVKVTFVE